MPSWHFTFHIACQNLSEYEYNFFKNNILPPGATQVNWFCSYCKNDQHPDKKAYDWDEFQKIKILMFLNFQWDT